MQFPDMQTTLDEIRELALPLWNFLVPIIPVAISIFAVAMIILLIRNSIVWGVAKLTERRRRKAYMFGAQYDHGYMDEDE